MTCSWPMLIILAFGLGLDAASGISIAKTNKGASGFNVVWVCGGAIPVFRSVACYLDYGGAVGSWVSSTAVLVCPLYVNFRSGGEYHAVINIFFPWIPEFFKH